MKKINLKIKFKKIKKKKKKIKWLKTQTTN